jgi:thiamine-phosphate diphosphorylase
VNAPGAHDRTAVRDGGLYLILTGPRSSHEELTAEAVRLEIPFVQLREKELRDDELLALAVRLRAVTAGTATRLIINDRADIAAKSDADGVHLGRTDMPVPEARALLGERIIGLSAASRAELESALEAGADYVGSGPVFPTATKATGRDPLGLAGIRELACMDERPPIVAIGGIGIGSVREVLAAGAEYAAVVSAVCSADEPAGALGDLVAMVRSGAAPGIGGVDDLDAQINNAGLRHCPRCAGGLRARRVRDAVRLTCARCGYVLYLPPAPVTCTIIGSERNVLLVRRRYPPREGFWCLPAGFVEPGEHPSESARREVREETGLDVEIVRVFDTWASNEDPRTPVVAMAFIGRIVGGELVPGDDASDAAFFPLNGLPENIAFTTHRTVLERYARETP